MPTAFLIAVMALFAAGRLLPDVDGGLGRGFVVALVAVAALVAFLPRGRRWMATLPAALLTAALLALLLPAVIPEASEEARFVAEFLVVASSLLALLRIGAVGICERIGLPVSRIVLDVFGWLLVGGALLTTLSNAGIKAGDLFTGSALITAVIGFALKETIGNVFAGLAIHAEHPFEVGDWIQYDPQPAHVGKVVEINWRATKVLTLDEAFVIIPNGQLAQASIRNFTKPEVWSRRSLYVITPYEVPPQRVHAIILEAVAQGFGVLRHPAPSVVTNGFTERGVEHWVRLFTDRFGQRDMVDGQARDRIWYALARHGIRIPVATHAVRLESPQPDSPEEALERRVACLARTGLLKPLDPALLNRLAAGSDERLYATGERVVSQDDPGASMFVIVSGRVEVTAAAAGQDRAATLAVLGAGDYFGEMSLLTGAPRVATVTAVEETRLIEVGKGTFAEILAAKPALVEELGRALQLRMAEREQAVAGTGRAVSEPPDILQKIREFFGA